jgi:hypothetical protein
MSDDDRGHFAIRRRLLGAFAATAVLPACRDAPPPWPPDAVPAGDTPAPLPEFVAARFPLRRPPGQRYLADASGRPFFLNGDTAWSLLVQLSRDETLTYLDDRRRRGVNALLVNLLEYTYAVDPPRNRQGDAPFLSSTDYATPNPGYFDHAAWVIDEARARGILVLLAASYIGCCNDAWYGAMVANGVDKMRAYGRFLGQRFGHATNILWVHGGDANPADQQVVGAVALGIREFDTVHLHTAHTAPGFQAMDIWGGAPWMDVNNVYTYDPVTELCLRAHARPDRLPFFLIESEYEGENRRAPDTRIRAQAWQTVLSGAMGQVVGNNPIWHFASPKPITPFKLTWQQALDSEAARSMSQLRRLIESVAWWRLEPDVDARVIVTGRCDGHDRAVAACDRDGGTAIVYLPQHRRVRLSADMLGGRAPRLRWYDPVAGQFGAPFRIAPNERGRLVLTSPARVHAGGDHDWVLVAERVP